MNSPAPTVSIVVAVYNVRDYIGEAIASLQAQSFGDFEALVIDDGSTDGSGAVARGAWGDDPRFRLIQQENRGLSGARNVGLAEARGEFVAFLDGDDAYVPATLEALLGALRREGTDWAASAITLTYPDGSDVVHAAIHGAEVVSAPQTFNLSDATLASRIFPSAWNKLYRRSVWADLRFPEGSWFEDHEAFWAFAAISPRLAYVPQPLYRHRRDRAGQITGTDSDRVFEQFAVLDRLRRMILAGGFRNADAGFAQLATRLIHERALVVMNRARRARFLAATNTHFATWGMAYTPGNDPSISRGLGQALAGRVPVSVVVVADPAKPEALRACLEALGAQSMADFQLVVLATPDVEVPAQLDCGHAISRDIAALTGASVVIYGPGEKPLPDGLRWLVNTLEISGAPLAFGGFQRSETGYHDGWTNNRVADVALQTLPALGAQISLRPEQALRLYPMLSNRILRPHLLPDLQALVGAGFDLCAAQSVTLTSAIEAGVASYTRLPVASVPQTPERRGSLTSLANWARHLPDIAGPPLPDGWRGTLFLRLARLTLGANAGIWAWLKVLGIAWGKGLARSTQGAAPDPETPRWVRAVCLVSRKP